MRGIRITAHQWQCNIAQLRHLAQLDESWCQPGQESARLKTLSIGAREALHRMVSKDYDYTDEEMEALYNQLVKNTQLQYFEKAIRTGKNLPETGNLPEPRD